MSENGEENSWLTADSSWIYGLPDLIPIRDSPLAFAPATHYAYEWKDYHFHLPGAEQLRVGTELYNPLKGLPGMYHVRFENKLGLARLQPFASGRPLAPPAYVEVISPKFPTLQSHYRFLQGLLHDLFSQVTRLPFTFAGETARGVAEVMRPPEPLFALHFFVWYRKFLQAALAAIHSSPHRQLVDAPNMVPLAEASEVDADVLVHILQHPDRWVPAQGFLLAERLGGRAPVVVWQRCPVDTFDTPENRFVLAFLQKLLVAAESLPAEGWWSSVPPWRRASVQQVVRILQQALHWSFWDDVGPMQRLPLSSRVLMRRAGYREMLQLWHLFHQARRPLFAPLQEAIELRDVATLYEFWAFFALVEEAAQTLGEEPAIELRMDDVAGLGWGAEARFGRKGVLQYNRDHRGYSIPLRPDYTWVHQGRVLAVLDAKFRLSRGEIEPDLEESGALGGATVKHDDLYKMHTYRDALSKKGVQTAVVVYPGDTPVFYDVERGRRHDVTLGDILTGSVQGVGALAMKPKAKEEEAWTQTSN